MADHFAPEVRTAFAATIEGLEAGELYPQCPRCKGDRQIYVYTVPPTDFSRGEGEYISCPCCHGTGEADADNARAFIRDWQEREELYDELVDITLPQAP